MIAVPDILHSLAAYFYFFLPVAAITIVFVGMTPMVRPTDRSGAGAQIYHPLLHEKRDARGGRGLSTRGNGSRSLRVTR